ncbi:hypothetical protein HU200_032877 [Digitaria exilis]|uniref:Uncharacterized protein n=1 Tax=Digitaria exilis TaxID=1010633 RepID=A0A835BK91_9POAL|nr:hypothetical protein HU200_032877 [Digitaria exilis]
MSEESEDRREEEDDKQRGGRERECPVVGQCEWNYAPSLSSSPQQAAAFLFMTPEVHSSQPAGIPQGNAAEETTRGQPPIHHGRKPGEWRFVGASHVRGAARHVTPLPATLA